MKIIRLEPYEYEWASHVATRRLLARENSNNAKHYDEKRMQDELHASTAACCCEIAVAKATNHYWGGHVWDARDHDKYKRIADVGETIEVRRIRRETNPVAIRQRDTTENRWIYAAYAQEPIYRTITIIGYIKATDGWTIGTPAPYDTTGNTRLIATQNLKPAT